MKIRPSIEQAIMSLTEGLTIIKSFKQLARPVFWTLLMWILVAASIVPVLRAFDIGAQFPLTAIFTVLLFLTLALSLPAAPAGIGIFEYACYLALVVHLPESLLESPVVIAEIGAFAALLHLTLAMPELVLGSVFLSREQLTISALSRLSRRLRSGPI